MGLGALLYFVVDFSSCLSLRMWTEAGLMCGVILFRGGSWKIIRGGGGLLTCWCESEGWHCWKRKEKYC